jgi:hypothetical protein
MSKSEDISKSEYIEKGGSPPFLLCEGMPASALGKCRKVLGEMPQVPWGNAASASGKCRKCLGEMPQVPRGHARMPRGMPFFRTHSVQEKSEKFPHHGRCIKGDTFNSLDLNSTDFARKQERAREQESQRIDRKSLSRGVALTNNQKFIVFQIDMNLSTFL